MVVFNNNILWFGDNYKFLCENIPNDSISLFYNDPPFDSGRNYNIIFKNDTGQEDKAQVEAFKDTWVWNDDIETQFKLLKENYSIFNTTVVDFVTFIVEKVWKRNSQAAYLTWASIRLLEQHRCLTKNGVMIYHCNQAMLYPIKMIADLIFGSNLFINHLIWYHYNGGGNKSKRKLASHHDDLLIYGKTKEYTFNVDEARVPYFSTSNYAKSGGITSKTGKKYQTNLSGKVVTDVWALEWKNDLKYTDIINDDDVWPIDIINPMSREKLHYDTQKPDKLLDRLIKIYSNKGEVVCDPAVGGGTTLVVAHRLGRRWIGCDVSMIAVTETNARLCSMFGEETLNYKFGGIPIVFDDVIKLAEEKPYDFQRFIVGRLRGRPGKKGTDGGVDGIKVFMDVDINKKMIFSVVSNKNNNNVADELDALRGVMEKESADMGVLVTLYKVSSKSRANRDKYSAGSYISKSTGKEYPRVQVLSAEGIFDNSEKLMYPHELDITFNYTQQKETVLFDTPVCVNNEKEPELKVNESISGYVGKLF